jgi:hypothetical protein
MLLIDWTAVLTIVKPHADPVASQRIPSRLAVEARARGRPPLPPDVQQLIAAMAGANATWGEERIAAELRLKLGLCVSPRTVRRHMPEGRARGIARRPSRGAPSFATTPAPCPPAISS